LCALNQSNKQRVGVEKEKEKGIFVSVDVLFCSSLQASKSL